MATRVYPWWQSFLLRLWYRRLPKWWQKNKRPLLIVGKIVVLLAVLLVPIALIDLEVRIYGTGFTGKTLWDWLQLLAALAIPVLVGFGAVWFTTRQGKVADAENTDNQRETALQAYIDKMSELLLEKKLRDSAEEDEVRKIARVRTLTILPRLDASRKGSVLQFLYESGLIDKDKRIIDISGADLDGAKLRGAKLRGASLRQVTLQKADLIFADLSEADLMFSDLSEADLLCAHLKDVELSYARLLDAKVSSLELAKAKSLKETIMPDGTKRKLPAKMNNK